MAYQTKHGGHLYLYDVDYGEETAVARVVVRGDVAGPEGLFLVKQDGALEPADDRPGFGPNRSRRDGLWPPPPREAVADARAIAQNKVATGARAGPCLA